MDRSRFFITLFLVVVFWCSPSQTLWAQEIHSFHFKEGLHCFADICDYTYEAEKHHQGYILTIFRYETFVTAIPLVKMGDVYYGAKVLTFESAQQNATRNLHLFATLRPDGVLIVMAHALRDIVDTNLTAWHTANLTLQSD